MHVILRGLLMRWPSCHLVAAVSRPVLCGNEGLPHHDKPTIVLDHLLTCWEFRNCSAFLEDDLVVGNPSMPFCHHLCTAGLVFLRCDNCETANTPAVLGPKMPRSNLTRHSRVIAFCSASLWLGSTFETVPTRASTVIFRLASLRGTFAMNSDAFVGTKASVFGGLSRNRVLWTCHTVSPLLLTGMEASLMTIGTLGATSCRPGLPQPFKAGCGQPTTLQGLSSNSANQRAFTSTLSALSTSQVVFAVEQRSFRVETPGSPSWSQENERRCF